MSDIQVTYSSTLNTSSTTQGQTKTQQQSPAAPASNSVNPTVNLSSQAQYLFEVDKYLSRLSSIELGQALDYLLQSDDPLQVKAADYFKKNQEILDNTPGGRTPVFASLPSRDTQEDLLNTGFVLDETTEIALLPLGVDVFRLDGKTNFSFVIFGGHNTALNNELDALEASAKGELGNKDFSNLFGSVRNALVFSENIMLSFDDVLHFNYGIEKAREAISFINAPKELATKLTDILNRSVAYQNSKQSQALSTSQSYVSNNRVGNIASENIRLGIAAQRLNGQIQGALGELDTSILDSQALLNRLLIDNPELNRFSPNKIDEAISFYKQDYANFERAINGELSTPTFQKDPDLFEGVTMDLDSNYTTTVIKNIQSYVTSQTDVGKRGI